MLKLDLSVRRVYIAAFAAIAYVLAHRHLNNYDWEGSKVLLALGADTLILSLLFGCFSFLDRWLQPRSLAARSHQTLHLALALLIITLAIGAQILFLKTGEILDIGILKFFFLHFSELQSAAQSVIDYSLLTTVLACFGFYFISLLRIQHPSFKGLQYLLLFFPAAILLFSALDDIRHPISEIVFEKPEKPLYQGVYQNLTENQNDWLSNNHPYWRQGVLSALSVGSAFGLSEYHLTANRITGENIYSPPHLTTPATKQRPNILFVIFESLRADVVGAYHGRPETVTPFLDKLARQSLLYEQVYTTVPHTSKALVGIYCGTFPKLGTDDFESTTEHYPIPCLPKLLASSGYQSAHFQTAPGTFEGRSQFLINAGFQHAIVQEDLDPDKKQTPYGYLGLDDRLLISPMLAWMQQQKKAGHPFFASLLTILTHHPYVSPGNIQPLTDPNSAKQNYLIATRYSDGVLRDLLREMKKRGLQENTLVVIVGDHGEGFGEHGQVAHNGTAYEEGKRVPLIIHAPGIFPEGRRIRGLRQHIDIAPSLLQLLGIAHDGKFPGKDLFTDPEGHAEIITSCFYPDYCLNHYDTAGNKMIYFYGKRPSEFYHLPSDPEERHNLAASVAPEEKQARLHRAVRLKKSYALPYPAGD